MKEKWLPVIISCSVAVGIAMGYFLTKRYEVPIPYQYQGDDESATKTEQILQLIEKEYVDTVDIAKIEEKIIPEIIKELDPHSAYIPAKDIEDVNSDLNGSFSGIGVQFNLQSDTIYVVDVIRGGPSERAGLVAGDRIVEVNDTLFVGKEINNEKVMKKLRGPKNTEVKLGIYRRGTAEMLHFTIVRDDIPVKSVESAYMIAPHIGYIYVSKFGANTYDEFLTSIAKLKKQGAADFIVDLRGNSGGYLEAASLMINEFLFQNQLIVYTEGKAFPRNEIRAVGTGTCKGSSLVLLTDEFSGSASEIFAGAIQDNDRGVIIGRRTFGKGLVQQQIPLSDNSALRLTVSRYYTPSGRCIQKPYKLGEIEEYEKDILNRYEHGEFYSRDSIRQADTITYYTTNGRKVYGGGGVMPDIFIPSDTSDITPYFTQLFNHAIMYKFALKYSEDNRAVLKAQGDWKAIKSYLESQDLIPQVVAFAQKQGIKSNSRDLALSKRRILKQTYAYIERNIIGDDGFYPILNTNDKCVEEAVKVLQDKKRYNSILSN